MLLGVAAVASVGLYLGFQPEEEQDLTTLAITSQYGGNGGSSFADQPRGKMTKIHVRHGTRID